MPIVTGDILRKYSTTAGSAGNSNSGTMAGSLGKYISTTQITTAVSNNLFPDISGSENSSSNADYKAEFVHNSHGSLTLQSGVIWISSEVAGGATIAIGVDTTAASAIGSSSAQALQIADKNTAPSGVSFSSPTTKGAGVAMGDIAAGFCRALWWRRTAANTAALSGDGGVVRYEADSAA